MLSETVRIWIKQGYNYVNLIGATASDARSVLVEGPAGILACCTKDERPTWLRQSLELRWPNGATSLIFSSAEPDRLRGKQHSKLAADELAAWSDPDAWDQALLGLRLGKKPQAVIATTPRPTKIIKQLIADPQTHVTRGSTYENRKNLAASFLSGVITKYENTRLGRQELNAEILTDLEGALWSGELIEKGRISKADLPTLKRIVVAIDPAMSANEDSNLSGIIAAGVDDRDHAYVLEDLSGKYAPVEMASKAIGLYHKWKADRVVAEINQGGAMVESTLRMIDPNVAYKAVSASRGKITRAEPVAALYEQGRVHHVGLFPELEDEMTAFAPNMPGSPDRGDALVWALTELLVENRNSTLGFLHFIASEAGAAGAAGGDGPGQLERLVRVIAPPGIGAARLFSGRDVSVPWDGSPIEMLESDAKPLLSAGWRRAPAST